MQASLGHKNASRMLFLGKCEGAAGNIFHVNLWEAFSIKCFAGLILQQDLHNLKLRTIINQSNTFTYNAAKIVSDYLKPLALNEYVIKDSLLSAEITKNYILDRDDEYVSYDVYQHIS